MYQSFWRFRFCIGENTSIGRCPIRLLHQSWHDEVMFWQIIRIRALKLRLYLYLFLQVCGKRCTARACQAGEAQALPGRRSLQSENCPQLKMLSTPSCVLQTTFFPPFKTTTALSSSSSSDFALTCTSGRPKVKYLLRYYVDSVNLLTET